LQPLSSLLPSVIRLEPEKERSVSIKDLGSVSLAQTPLHLFVLR
jgi:hypothetical protein